MIDRIDEHRGDQLADDAPTPAPTPTPTPTPREAWGRYLFALILYVTLSVSSLALRDNVLLLNWIIGPLFPVVVLYVIPTSVKALAERVRSR